MIYVGLKRRTFKNNLSTRDLASYKVTHYVGHSYVIHSSFNQRMQFEIYGIYLDLASLSLVPSYKKSIQSKVSSINTHVSYIIRHIKRIFFGLVIILIYNNVIVNFHFAPSKYKFILATTRTLIFIFKNNNCTIINF